MRKRLIAAVLIGLAPIAGCNTTESGGSSLGSSFTRGGDTLGTQRRMDVYGGATAPVLPTMGAAGYGR